MPKTFDSRDYSSCHRSGSIHNHTQTRVTAKGAEYIGTLWASQNAVVYQQPSQQLPQQQEVANA